MDFIGELLLTALLAIAIVAVLVFVGWTLIIVGAAQWCWRWLGGTFAGGSSPSARAVGGA